MIKQVCQILCFSSDSRFQLTSDVTSSEDESKDESDTPRISRLENVFSDYYFYDTYKESMESSDNDEL